MILWSNNIVSIYALKKSFWRFWAGLALYFVKFSNALTASPENKYLDTKKINVEKEMQVKFNFYFVEELNRGAFQFEQRAVKLKRKYWWQNLKVHKTRMTNFWILFLVSKLRMRSVMKVFGPFL